MFNKPTTFVLTLLIIVTLFALNNKRNVIASCTMDVNNQPLTVGLFKKFVEKFVSALQNQCCAESLSCPKSQLPVITLETNTYYFATGFMANWTDAHQFCKLHGMKLVALETEKENEVVTEHVRRLGVLNSYWLSGTDEDSKGNFYWSLTGKPIQIENWSATPWGPGEPNNKGSDEDCLTIKTANFLWNDERCAKLFNFICEM